MTAKTLVLHQIEYTFEKESWQPSLLEALDGLTAAQAEWRPAPGRHSIWQIVRHLTHWKAPMLRRWEGENVDIKAIDESDWQEATGDDAAWQADVRALREVTERIRDRITEWNDEALEWVPEGGRFPRAHGIMAMATHDAYHAGQIRYLRALQGV